MQHLYLPELYSIHRVHMTGAEWRSYLDLGHLRVRWTARSSAHLHRQVGHLASLLNELVEAAQAAQLHHNGQGYTTNICLYGLQQKDISLFRQHGAFDRHWHLYTSYYGRVTSASLIRPSIRTALVLAAESCNQLCCLV